MKFRKSSDQGKSRVDRLDIALLKPRHCGPSRWMFNACVDWHSNVHAAYSLYVAYGLTKDRQYLDLAESKVKNELVPAEITYMETTTFRDLTFLGLETSYGIPG